MELPVCRYRGPCEGGKCPCTSPLVSHAPPGVVQESYCLKCDYPDKVPTPRQQKILGLSTGPKWLDRIKTFARALYRHAKNWFRSTSKIEHARRLSICHACPFYRPAYAGGRCSKCGCGIGGNVADKTRWASEKCPEGKW